MEKRIFAKKRSRFGSFGYLRCIGLFGHNHFPDSVHDFLDVPGEGFFLEHFTHMLDGAAVVHHHHEGLSFFQAGNHILQLDHRDGADVSETVNLIHQNQSFQRGFVSHNQSISSLMGILNTKGEGAVDYSVIVPVYNSKETLNILLTEIDRFFQDTGQGYEVILVDDASADGSFAEIERLSKERENVHGVGLLRNAGQQKALLLGLRKAQGHWAITIDDDLQHDIQEASLMMKKAEAGADLVFGVYKEYGAKDVRAFGSRLVGLFFKRRYRNLKGLGVSSFRLISKEVYQHLQDPGERFVYLSAELLPHARVVDNVPVSRRERVYGQSGYNLKKCAALYCKLWFHYGWPNPRAKRKEDT